MKTLFLVLGVLLLAVSAVSHGHSTREFERLRNTMKEPGHAAYCSQAVASLPEVQLLAEYIPSGLYRYGNIGSATLTNVKPESASAFHGNFIPNPYHFSKEARDEIRKFLNMQLKKINQDHLAKIYPESVKTPDSCAKIGKLPDHVDTFPGMILTQGPLPKTVAHHLQLVFELKSPVVVAIGPDKEKNREKFSNYFSDKFCETHREKEFAEGWSVECAPSKTTHASEEEKGLFERKMKIKHDSKEHQFILLHLPDWPDHTAPTKNVQKQIKAAFEIIQQKAGQAQDAQPAFLEVENYLLQHIQDILSPPQQTHHQEHENRNLGATESNPHSTHDDNWSDYQEQFSQEDFPEPAKMKNKPTGTVIVHCSAGVGRSGTFVETFNLGRFLKVLAAESVHPDPQQLRDLLQFGVFVLKWARDPHVVMTHLQYDSILGVAEMFP